MVAHSLRIQGEDWTRVGHFFMRSKSFLEIEALVGTLMEALMPRYATLMRSFSFQSFWGLHFDPPKKTCSFLHFEYKMEERISFFWGVQKRFFVPEIEEE